MKLSVPTVEVAEKLLFEAKEKNPGSWVIHNHVAGNCARKIALACADLDVEVAYVLGLLHDIGRREGMMDMRHIYCGYQYMSSLGYVDSARICLTHSFPYKNIAAYNGSNDCNQEESEFIQNFLNDTTYDDYDRLIQLCDAISYPTGPTYLERRLVDVVRKRGFNEHTLPKWEAFFDVKAYFDCKASCDIYTILQG